MEPDPPPPTPAEILPPPIAVPPALAPPLRVNPCVTAPDEMVAGHCIVCGRRGQGWTATLDLATRGEPPRCDACYRVLATGAVYCGHCGRRARHERGAEFRTAHAQAGRKCPEALAAEQAAPAHHAADVDPERELQPVRDIGVFYAAMLAPLLLLYFWAVHIHEQSLAVHVIGEFILYAIILIFAWRWRALVLPPLLTPPSRPRIFLAILVLTPPFTLAVHALITNFLEPLFPRVEYRYSDQIIGAGYGWWAVYLSVAVGPAIFEEIAFRGIILRKLEQVMSPAQALVTTSLMFAIIHYNVLGLVIFLVPLAMAMGWTVQKTGSLWPAMLIHFLHNAGVVLQEQLNS